MRAIEERADVVLPFVLAGHEHEAALRGFSLSAVLAAARIDPQRGVALAAEGAEVLRQLAAPLAHPSSARRLLWGRVVAEASREVAALAGLAAAARSRGVEKGFVGEGRVKAHVKALGRLVLVAMRCAWADQHFGPNEGGKESRGASEALLRDWRNLLASGGWEAPEKIATAGVFSEPRCWACWNFIGPLDTVACPTSPDSPCHMACANLLANRFSDVQEL